MTKRQMESAEMKRLKAEENQREKQKQKASLAEFFKDNPGLKESSTFRD